MRFTVRSLAVKIAIGAGLTLLLCMLLFSSMSWFLLKFYYEHEAKSDANTHLTLLRQTYRARASLLLQELSHEASNPTLVRLLAQTPTNASRYQLNEQLLTIYSRYHFSDVRVLGQQQEVLASISNVGARLSPDFSRLVATAMREESGIALTRSTLESTEVTNADASWDINYAVPIVSGAGTPMGVLVGIQHLDTYFVSDLLSESGALNIALCQDAHVLGTTARGAMLNYLRNAAALCEPGVVTMFDAGQRYLALSAQAQVAHQLAGTPALLIVDIEPLYSFNTHTGQAIIILTATGLFALALSIIIYTYVIRAYYIRPLRRLQSRVAALMADQPELQAHDARHAFDELGMLDNTVNLLSESLDTRESESHAITSQMSDLLALSDVLISTLHLEDLLREIVSRLGMMMRVKSVSLLLYGRDMLSPWAVAQWTDQQQANGHTATNSNKHGAVTVHADPSGDITMAATTKLAAIPNGAARSATTPSGKRPAIRASRLTPEPYGLRRPRIPRPALRDIDLMLARMAMQKQRITYAENVDTLYQERGETWARMALEAGYQSAIAVPLVLQDQAIGAVMLYSDRPVQVTGGDKFLFSTAAIQAAMAIQNALLFSEVKNKNAALERANQLKSQFLANVTHELRTPLHSIISYGSLIVEGYVDGELTSEQQEHIEFMVRRAEDLTRLVDDMLDLSKIEADRLEVKIEALSLETSLRDVVNELKQMASNKGLQLTLETEEELPMVLADSHRIRQVLINMVSNALKFTEKGGVTIRCAVLERFDLLRISVSDTGIGISPAALGYIFEAFRQADGSTTRRFGGTGLGLTIARKLIELQGGEVTVESMVGQGSTFSFTLPLAAPARVRASR